MALSLALSAVALWAVTLTLAKPGLARMDAIAYGLVRPVVASLLILPYAWIVGGLVYPGAGLLALAALGGIVDMFIGVALFMFAMKRVSAHEAGPLSNTAPLWGVIVAAIWLREAPVAGAYVAALLVVVGSYLLAAPRVSMARRAQTIGLLAALGAGVCWGIADTAIAKYCLTHGMAPETAHLVYMTSAALCWGIVALLRGRLRVRYFAWNGLRVALLTSLTGMFAGMLLWFRALDLAPASLLSPTRGALSLFVFVLSVVFLRERPTRRAGVGVGLVAAGVALVSFYGT